MSIYEKLPKFAWRLMKLPHIFYKLGLYRLMGSFVLLLTTTGRRTGRKRVTPLQYEEIQGVYYIASARGPKADWYRNILTNSNVEVQVKSNSFRGLAKPTVDPKRIADFLEVRLKRHPVMMGNLLRSEGLPQNPTREQLESFAQDSAMVVIKTLESKKD